MSKTPVVFRKLDDGQILALLPTMPVTDTKRPTACLGYTAASGFETIDTSLVRVTKEARPNEYQLTFAEIMKQFPYEEFTVNKRVTDAMLRERQAVKHRQVFYSQGRQMPHERVA